ncbi:MAG: acetate--CoA ligase family protein [Alphaproteobacteria bacterium]|nr:acetate--CoA ligase family protein [Alphaproteobacteria bacterium]
MNTPASPPLLTGRTLLEPLFRPAAVAFIGASDDKRKMAGRPLHFLKKHGFAGNAYPVNPSRATVLGHKAYPSLRALPEPVEHAFILLPTDAVEGALADCAAAGVKVATVFAGGFAEAGAEGVAKQERLLAIARAGGMRLVGPNCLGVINPHRKLALSASNVLELERLIPGKVAVISQSGSLTGTILSRGAERDFGFSKLISVGNEADLKVGEIGLALVEDGETEAFLLYLETLRDAPALAAFALAAHAAGKPIIAYKLGRSEAGRHAAVSHTGALVGPDAAVDAFFAAHGIVRVDLFETLLDMAPLVIGRRPPAVSLERANAGVSVLTTTGGGGAMVVDRLGAAGLKLVGADAATIARVGEKGIAVQPGTMVDLTAAGIRHDIVVAALGGVLADPAVAAAVAVAGSTAQFYPHLSVDPIAAFAGAAKPLIAYIVPPAEESRRMLIARGIAAFRSPEAAADCIRALFAWQAPSPPATAAPSAALVHALAALPPAPGEADAYRVVSALGIPVAAHVVIGGADDASRAARLYPAAVKVQAAAIAHKTDAGGVVLGVGDADALRAAVRSIEAAVVCSHPGAAIAGYLVQRMERGVAEVLLGYARDPQVGPIVTLGMGGILAELYGDVAVRLAPVGTEDAHAMIDTVKGLKVLSGYRGLPMGDRAALARAIVAFSGLAATAIVEAEINPLIVKPEGGGVVAVDALVRP